MLGGMEGAGRDRSKLFNYAVLHSCHESKWQVKCCEDIFHLPYLVFPPPFPLADLGGCVADYFESSASTKLPVKSPAVARTFGFLI